jgi:hypothetical protein
MSRTTTVTDARGGVSYYTWSGHYVTQQVDALGEARSFEHDEVGYLVCGPTGL